MKIYRYLCKAILKIKQREKLEAPVGATAWQFGEQASAKLERKLFQMV